MSGKDQLLTLRQADPAIVGAIKVRGFCPKVGANLAWPLTLKFGGSYYLEEQSMFEDQLAKLPLNPPRSPALLPGLRLSSAISKTWLSIPLFFAVMFTFMPLVILTADPKARLAFGRTETVEGHVVAVTTNECRGQGRQITYAFSPPRSPEYRATASFCPGSPYFDLGPGNTVPVEYLISDPSVSLIVGQSRDRPPYLMFFLFPLFGALMFAPTFVPQMRDLLHARRCFKRGVVATGTVLFVKRGASWAWPGGLGASGADVFVAYQLPSGTGGEAKARCNNDWLLGHLSPGASVNIAFLPERPSRAALLEAYIR